MGRKKEYEIGEQVLLFEYETKGTYTKKIVKLNDASFLAMVGAMSEFSMRSAAKISVEENFDYDQLMYYGLRTYEELLDIKNTVYGPNASLTTSPQKKEQLRKREQQRRKKKYLVSSPVVQGGRRGY